MKFLLVMAVLVVAVWVWRNNRQTEANPEAKRPAPTGLPLAMVACLECGTHLPESDAVRGPRGSYCCAEHRRQHERSGA